MESGHDATDFAAQPNDSADSGGRGAIKHSYTIPCASAFRDALEDLARRRRVNVGDIARSVLLVMPADAITQFPDPGEPAADDRETVILKSGPAQGRPWRRKPRLQVRMAPGYEIGFIRGALAIALAMDRGEVSIRLDGAAAEPAAEAQARPASEPSRQHALEAFNEELERLRAIVNVLSFEPLPDGINSRDDALHVLGFPPGSRPDRRTVRARFRMLATIHHPDSNYGSHHRMSQLNQAMEFLRDSA